MLWGIVQPVRAAVPDSDPGDTHTSHTPTSHAADLPPTETSEERTHSCKRDEGCKEMEKKEEAEEEKE